MTNLRTVVDAMNQNAVIPDSSDFQDGTTASGFWYDTRKGDDGNERIVEVEQVVGGSGVYLVEYDYLTNEILRDDRPWQMSA